MTLEQARQANNLEASKPLLERQPQQQALVQAPSTQQFNQGTAWTRDYSPVPTSSPGSSISSLPSSSGPKGYTAPRGGSIDAVSTSSISNGSAGPKVIRSSVGSKASQRRAKTTVDPVRVATVPNTRSTSTAAGGWTSAGGTVVTLQNGETFYSVSRRYGVPVDALTKANNISDPTRVRSGQQVLVPTYVYSPNAPISKGAVNKPQHLRNNQAPATVKDNSNSALSQSLPPKVARSGSNGVYVVQKGDTLSSIASRNKVSLASLRNSNGLHTSDVIRIGQKLNIAQGAATASYVEQLPRLDKNTTSSVTSYAPNTLSSSPRTKPVLAQSTKVHSPLPPEVRAPRVKPAHKVAVAKAVETKKPAKAYTPPKIDPIKTATTKAVQAKKEATTSTFIWPARGEIISRFGKNQDGQKNDGIDLSVPEGTPVLASASGEVIYASNGLADYGNLILIRHSNGFVSAYAHNQQLLVQRGERVRQGQVIGKAGKTGSVKTPQLHFELRNGKTPVDPLNHLSG